MRIQRAFCLALVVAFLSAGWGASVSADLLVPRVSGAASLQGNAAIIPLAESPFKSLRVSFPQADVMRLTAPAAGAPPLEASGVTPRIRETASAVVVSSPALRLIIDRQPLQWHLQDAKGRLIVEGGATALAAQSGVSWESGNHPAYTTNVVDASFHSPSGGAFYGFGQRFNFVDETNVPMRSWICDCAQIDAYADRGDSYYNIPFFWSPRGWGLFLNATGDIAWDVGHSEPDTVRARVPGTRNADIYVFAPGSPREVFDRYTDLVGKPNLPPRWAFEPWIDGVYGNEDGTIRGGEAAMRDYLAHFDANDLSVRNVVVEDWTTLWWMGARWTWDPALFPDPAGFMKGLKDQGLRVHMWETPAIGVANTEWPLAAARGYFVQDATGAPKIVQPTDNEGLTFWMEGISLVDFTNPEARAWWAEKHQPLFAMGIDGYKADGGEEVTPDMVFYDGTTGVTEHNRAPVDYNRALYDDLVAARGEGAMISRSGGVGSQLASGLWNGDQTSGLSWTRRNLIAGLAASNSGLPWWTFDHGGLTGTMTRDDFLRNLEINILSPWFKVHLTWDHPRAPWDYDAAALDTFRYYEEVRASLMDYLYDAARDTHETGVPMVRILDVDYPMDPGSRGDWTEFLVGDRLLAAPAVFSNQAERDIHLPPGNWMDLTTGETYLGPVDLIGYDTPAELLPLFWRTDGRSAPPPLPAHPVLPPGWRSDHIVRAPPGSDAPDYVQVTTGHIAGPVLAATPATTAVVEFPVGDAPRGEGWVRLAWSTGPAFAYLQENYLNMKVIDAQGDVVASCGSGGVMICRINSWTGAGTWRAEITTWTGHAIDWETTIVVPY